MSNDKKLDFLQALRGLAIMMVVLSHARWFFLVTPYQQTAETLLHGGAAGVDIFFVISGFIMAYTTKGNDGSPASLMRFYIRRFTKIWIPYAVIGIVTFAVAKGTGIFVHENLIWIAKSLIFIPPDAHSFLYLGGGLTDVAWSLNYEAYFYLIFGLSMLFARFRYVALFGWCGICLIAVPLWDHGHASLLVTARVNSDNAYLQLMTNPIIFEFLGGVIIGKIYCSSFVIRDALTARLVAFSGCVGFLWCILENIASDNGLLGWGGWAVAMVLAISLASKSTHIPFPAVLAWIGNISYALYLVHPLVNMVAKELFLHYGLMPLIPTIGHVILTTSISILVAAFAHSILDERLHVKIRDGLLASRLFRAPRISISIQSTS
ncbi:acyltransferase [Luteibacter sp. 9133]|uniref:acyltransferase family protein n=1 Tax=Luteibacter sp. 9133 TaxID=1500891 RepID=UPI0005B770EE|nr:acyltransferase [Luteibacter sp. 9133]